MFPVLVAAGTAVVSWLLPRLLSVAGTVVVSQTVITPIFTYLQNTITAKLGGMSADAVSFFQFVGIPDAISVIFAAYAMAIGIKSAKAAFQRSGARGA
jgi:hypothetical protein